MGTAPHRTVQGHAVQVLLLLVQLLLLLFSGLDFCRAWDVYIAKIGLWSMCRCRSRGGQRGL